MPPEEVTVLVKKLRRTPLHAADRGVPLLLNGTSLHRLVPHRDPFLLIDAIEALDKERRTVRGRRRVRPDDPVFAGHFPGQPVYPGVLQVEAMGQLALCLARLLADDGGAAPGVRATHIHHAMFLAPVGPGDDLELHAGIVEDSGLTAISAGQVYKQGVLCACAVQEVYFVD